MPGAGTAPVPSLVTLYFRPDSVVMKSLYGSSSARAELGMETPVPIMAAPVANAKDRRSMVGLLQIDCAALMEKEKEETSPRKRAAIRAISFSIFAFVSEIIVLFALECY